MAMFFDKVPLELRRQIYRELLVDKTYVMEPQGKCHMGLRAVPGKIYPAILGTCQQAYDEASTVFYGENDFLYFCTSLCGTFRPPIPFNRYEFPEGRFERMKHVTIGYRGNTPQIYTGTDLADCEEITNVLKRIAALRCSLKTLWISFLFLGPTLLSRNPGACAYDIARLIVNNDVIKKIITDLMVEQSIQISVTSHYIGDCQRLKLMAKDVGARKGWAVSTSSEEAYGKAKEVASDSDIPVRKWLLATEYDVRTRYHWNWMLTPSTTLIPEEESQVAKPPMAKEV